MPPPTAASSPPVAKRAKSSQTWKQRKQELSNLRTETRDLERCLSSLRMQHHFTKMLDECAQISDSHKRWKEKALGERKQCREAIAENSKLREKINQCRKTLAALQTCATRAQAESNEQLASSSEAARALRIELASAYQLDLCSNVLCQRLEALVNARACELDTFFGDHEPFEFDPSMAPVRVRRANDTDSTASIEFMHDRVLPFSAEYASSVAWGLMKLGAFPSHQCTSTRVVGPSNEMLVTEGHLTFPLECGGTASIHSICLMKPVVVRGGFMLQVEAMSEWHAYPVSSNAWSYVTRDSGWVTVKADRMGNPDICRIQSMMRLTSEDPGEIGSKSKDSLLARGVSEAMIPCMQRLVKSRYQLLENALLDMSAVAEVK